MLYKKTTIISSTFLSFLLLQLFVVCTNNRQKDERVSNKLTILGRYLFFDRRLSINNTRSCATCHNPQFAFTDGYKRSLGAFADLHQRNTQPLFNLIYFRYLTGADSSIHSTDEQMNNPLFNDHPVEMGVKGNEETILARIKSDALYQQLFAKAFPHAKNAFTWEFIKKAISHFMYSIRSDQSPYDNYMAGDSNAISVEQKKGKQLFFSEKLSCAKCHGGFNFSSSSVVNENGDTLHYFNTGLYNIDGKGSYPEYDQGLYQHTKQIKDMGVFRVPSLRNLAFTAPYFHDGSAASLIEVLDMYSNGGRSITTGVYQGNGISNPYKHPLVNGFTLSVTEKKALLLFLNSLTDSSFITNPDYANPFTEDETKKK
jgi:cytochrome c peroxidase